MADSNDELDDVRHQHHLKHRGRANQHIFWITWSLITFLIATIAMHRVYRWWTRRCSLKYRPLSSDARKKPSLLNRSFALLKALQIFPLPHIFHTTLPEVTSSRLIFLILYVTVATVILTAVNAPTFSQHFLDDIAFRAAWLTLTQLPLVYFLSTKRGPTNLLAGVSHERINWLHRWVSRILLITATAHVALMKSSITTDDILHSDERSMTVVRYGIGAYSMLLWIAATSILPLRRWSYRVFYINHWISSIAFLVVVFQHIPTYARAPIYLSASFLAVDKTLVTYFFLRNNFSICASSHRFANFGRLPRGKKVIAGYAVELLPPSSTTLAIPDRHSTTIIRIANVPITWRPGQHIRLYIPALGKWDSHPFTPANCAAIRAPPLPPRKDVERGGQVESRLQKPKQTSNIILMVKGHKGWTRRLAEYHRGWLERPCPNANSSAPCDDLVAYFDGPYGDVPHWEEYESLVLLATGTGISFTLAILDWLEQLCFMEDVKLVTRTFTVVWMVRHIDPVLQESVENLLERYAMVLKEADINLSVEIYVSCSQSIEEVEMKTYDPFAHLRQQKREGGLLGKPPLRIRNPDDIYAEWDREAEMEMREMDMRAVEPSGEEEDWYAYETNAGSDVSETDTLVNGSEGEEEDHTSSELLEREEEDCQCAQIQHCRSRKPDASHKTQETINRYYGARCDISKTLSEATLQESSQKTMIAVCGSREAARTAREAVSLINWTYALGMRTASAELHIEGGGVGAI